MRNNPKGSSYNSPTERKGSGRPLPNTKLETAWSTRAKMSSSSRCESSSSESADAKKDPFSHLTTRHFVIPSPVECSDSYVEASPSPYRMEMAGKQTEGRSLNEEEENNYDEEEDISEYEEEGGRVRHAIE